MPLAELDDLVFGAWDIFPDDAYESAAQAPMSSTPPLLENVRDELEAIRPWPAVFDPAVREAAARHARQAGRDQAGSGEQLMADIEAFRRRTGVRAPVMVWCGSTESFLRAGAGAPDPRALRGGAARQRPHDPPEHDLRLCRPELGIPFANGAPNLTVDVPALVELADSRRVPICGKDFKTGQTLMKTIIAPGLKARMLGLSGWFSTNILGNRDGEVLDEPSSFRTKEESKLSVLDVILRKDLHPELYGDYVHRVNIQYYPPRGDNKEGWDNIDIFGWLGYPMQIKINFLCRDSILAAPLVLDLALFLDLAQRAGMHGIQEWLSFYFKSPQTAPGAVSGARPVHSADEAEEHAALSPRRRADHPPRLGILRLEFAFPQGVSVRRFQGPPQRLRERGCEVQPQRRDRHDSAVHRFDVALRRIFHGAIPAKAVHVPAVGV